MNTAKRKNLLVTGTSTGLGLHVAVEAAKKGYRVFATMRNLAKREALDEAAQAAGVEIEVLPLDVTDTESVQSCVDTIVEKGGGVDALINNAGIGFVRSTEQTTEGEIAKVIDVNLMGVIRCTKAVLPHMREQRSGHIVTISSVGGLVGQPFNEIYCASKFAVEGYMEALACYVSEPFNIHFSVVEPGGIRSEFAASALKQIENSGGFLDDEYRPILERYIAGTQTRSDSDGLYQEPEEVAAVALNCLESDAPPIRVRTSAWGENLCALKTSVDPDGRKMQRQVAEMFLGAAESE